MDPFSLDINVCVRSTLARRKTPKATPPWITSEHHREARDRELKNATIDPSLGCRSSYDNQHRTIAIVCASLVWLCRAVKSLDAPVILRWSPSHRLVQLCVVDRSTGASSLGKNPPSTFASPEATCRTVRASGSSTRARGQMSPVKPPSWG